MPDIRLTLSTDASGAIRGIKTVEDGLEGVDKKAKSVEGALKAAFGGAYFEKLLSPAGAATAAIGAATVAIGASVKAIADATVAAAAYGGKLADLGAKTGIETEALQRLTQAGRLTGTSLESMAAGVSKMQRALVETPQAFNAVGLSAANLIQMQPDQAFARIASEIARIKNPAERAAAAIEIFGKSGAELLPVLTSNLALAGNEAERLGMVLSGETVAALDEFGDRADTLKATWEGLWIQIGAAIATSPAVQQSIKDITEAVGALSVTIGQLRETGILDFVINRLVLMTRVAAGIGTLGLSEVLIQFGKLKSQSDWAMYQTKGPGFPTAPDEAIPDPFTKAGMERIMGGADAYAAGMAKAIAANKAYEDAAERAVKAAAKLAAAMLRVVSMGPFAPTDVERLLGNALTRLPTVPMPQLAGGIVSPEAQRALMTYRETIQVIGGYTVNLASQQDRVNLAIGRGAVAAMTLKTTLKGALESLPAVIMAAIQGGGNVGQAVGSKIGGDIGKFLGPKLGKHLGDNAGKIFGPLGEIGGQILGSLAGKLIDKLFSSEGKKVNDLRDQFISAAGGLDVLRQKAFDAGMTLDKLLAAKKVKDFEAAMRELQSAFDLQAEAQRKLQEAIDRYKFTIEELGPTMARQKLDEMAAQLIQDYALLSAAGVNHNAIIARMGPNINEYVQAALRAGSAIPEAMRPILQAMIDQGLLLDANGNAYKSLEDVGVSFAQTMTEQFKTLMEKITALINALLFLNGKTINTYVRTHYSETYDDDDDDEEGKPRPRPRRRGAAAGFDGWISGPMSGYRAPITMHGTEHVAITPAGRAPGGAGTSNADVVRELRSMRDDIKKFPFLIRDVMQQAG